MGKPHVEILVHEDAGKLVKIEEVITALKWFRSDIQSTPATSHEYRKGATEMLDSIIMEIRRWSKKP